MNRSNSWQVSCLVALGVGAAFGQSSAARFEIADIHPSPPTVNYHQRYTTGGQLYGDRYEIRRATMLDLIETAWGLDERNVLGGPSWLDMDRFDVRAKVPPGATRRTVQPMLQALLAERFGLQLHNDKKPVPAYALTAGKTPKLKPADDSGKPGCPANVQNPSPDIVFTCHNVTMSLFAMQLQYSPGGYIDENLVADRTGLTGGWDFTFRYTPRSNTVADPNRITLFEAMEQLGLQLEPAMVPQDVVVIDRVNQEPTANVPDIAKAFPAGPTEFEAAAIKPSAPGPHRLDAYVGGLDTRVQYLPGGRLNAQANLHGLIRWIWGRGDSLIAGMPAFADDDSWDIQATASDATVDSDTQNLMLTNLLMTRFKLAFHMEERPVMANTLVAVKPKMKRADPASRTGCKEGTATPAKDDPRDANPMLGRLITCTNTSMAQFAYLLFHGMAAGYVGSPVADATGLEGGWDFTLSFSAPALVKGVDAATSEPNGAVSLPDAMEKQIGVKMEMRKQPTEVLVIDHLERTPTEN
jgi:uncharacterized protein (TIGR03435 family)